MDLETLYISVMRINDEFNSFTRESIVPYFIVFWGNGVAISFHKISYKSERMDQLVRWE